MCECLSVPRFTLDDTSTESVLGLLERVAAEIINPRFRALSGGQIAEKKPGDYVTIADRESEAALTETLQAADPGAFVVGEEAVAADPGLLDRLAAAEHAYVIDPLDGTRNFVRGSDDHAMLLAELRDGEAVRGWIWQPQHQLAVVAERGRGVLRNGARVVAPPVNDPPNVATSMSTRHFDPPGIEAVRTRWCCGVDYPDLLAGTIDALAYRNPKPWDHAAGALMVRELGGVVRFADGTDYVPGRPVEPGQILLVASSPAVAEQIGRG